MATYSVSVGAVQTSTTSAALTVPMPSVDLAGRLTLVIGCHRSFNGASITTTPVSSGYTELAYAQPGTDKRIYIWGKIGATTDSNVTVDWAGTDDSAAWAISVYSSTGWLPIGSVAAGYSSNGATATAGNWRWPSHTMLGSGNFALQVGVKPTSGSPSAIAETSGWTDAGEAFDAGGTTAYGGQWKIITGDATANTASLTGDTASAAVTGLTLECIPGNPFRILNRKRNILLRM